jgi:hypothetical protein
MPVGVQALVGFTHQYCAHDGSTCGGMSSRDQTPFIVRCPLRRPNSNALSPSDFSRRYITLRTGRFDGLERLAHNGSPWEATSWQEQTPWSSTAPLQDQFLHYLAIEILTETLASFKRVPTLGKPDPGNLFYQTEWHAGGLVRLISWAAHSRQNADLYPNRGVNPSQVASLGASFGAVHFRPEKRINRLEIFHQPINTLITI